MEPELGRDPVPASRDFPRQEQIGSEGSMAEVKLSWREKLKIGPFKTAYAYIRWAKRSLAGERVDVIAPYAPPPLSLDVLRSLAACMPGAGRLYFSQALGYLERGGAKELRMALAC